METGGFRFRFKSGYSLAALVALLSGGVLFSQESDEWPTVVIRAPAEVEPRTADEAALGRYFGQFLPAQAGSIWDTAGHIRVYAEVGYPPGYRRPDPLEAFQRRLCDDEVVVVLGSPRSRRLVVTSTETNLFSLYSFDVAEWVKPSAGPLTVAVGHNGGLFQWEGREIGLIPDSEGVLAPNTTSLLLLTTLPGSSAYVVGRAMPVREGQLSNTFLPDEFSALDDFLDLTRRAVAACPR